MAEMWVELRRQLLQDELRAALKADRVAHLKDRTRHPRAKPVITPDGTFASAALAAEKHGIGRQHAARLARLGLKGWSYGKIRKLGKFGLRAHDPQSCESAQVESQSNLFEADMT